MKEKKQIRSRWFYGGAVLVILFGILISAWVLKDSGLTQYPTMIADAYGEEQHRLSVPGSKDIKLTRAGAYGIYYEYSPANSLRGPSERMPPAIDCSLTEKSTGAETEAVPDYVETNRYWSKDQVTTGVLIMSVTVNGPGAYTFACHYQDGSIEPEIGVALGPNYVWEFLSVAGKISLSLFKAMAISFMSVAIGLIIVFIVAIKRRERPREVTN